MGKPDSTELLHNLSFIAELAGHLKSLSVIDISALEGSHMSCICQLTQLESLELKSHNSLLGGTRCCPVQH